MTMAGASVFTGSFSEGRDCSRYRDQLGCRPTLSDKDYTRKNTGLMMGTSDTISTGLTFFDRLMNVIYALIPTLIGLGMILWGIFFNGWDWTLILVGLVVLLLFGYYTYKALTWNPSE
jgi:ABC-type transport system involved in Fe-S cluster assembly fused permease/ATPase subunit